MSKHENGFIEFMYSSTKEGNIVETSSSKVTWYFLT